MGRLVCTLFSGSRRTCAPLVLTAALAWTAAAAGATVGPLAAAADGTGAVRVTVTGLEPAWTAAPGPGSGRFALGLPGFTGAAEPGAPSLPVAAAWLLVPPGTRPQLDVEAEDWQDAGARPLAITPVPAGRPGPAGLELVEIELLPGQPVPADLVLRDDVRAALDRAARPRGGPAAELGEVAWWRGRRVVPLRVVPVRHDGAGRAQAVLASGAWRVRFVPDKAAAELPPVARKRLATANDERFGALFLNPDQLRDQPTEAAWQGIVPVRGAAAKARGGQAGTLLAPEVKLAVRSTRLYRVGAARLRERGLLPDTPIQESEIRLYQRRYLPELDDGSGNPPWAEIEVPIRMVGDGGLFEGDDFFVFYGLRPRDDTAFTADLGEGPVDLPDGGDLRELANDGNVYWLAAAQPDPGQAWARMETASLPAAAGEPLRNYRRTDHYEEQLVMRENVALRQEDRLVQNHQIDTDVAVGIASQWAPDPIGNSARIEVGASSYANATVSIVRWVRFDLVVDDVPVQELGLVDLRFDTERVFGWDVAAPLLAGQNAKVTMTKVNPAGSLFSYLNWVRVSYDALYRAVGGEQRFHTGDAAGPRPIEVTGFGDADLGLVEITDPRRPVWITLAAGNVVDAGGGSFTLSILPTQAAADRPRAFWACDDLAGTGVAEFAWNAAVAVPDPVDPTAWAGGDLDLLVVTHDAFAAGVDRWVAHRKARAGGDLQVHVVDVADLYDWYGGGLKTPWAVKRMAAHALARWNAWALVIVGDANENQRQLAVPAAARGWSVDWVPTHYHVQSELGGHEFMATDKWFVTDETGTTDATDDFPDQVRAPWSMLSGRLVCNSAEELDRMVDKIVTVETPAAGQDWRRRGIFFADDAFSNGYGAEALQFVEYRGAGEEQFAWSERDSLAAGWRAGTPVSLEADTLFLDNWLSPLFPGTDDRPIDPVKNATASVATPPLLAALSRGGLIAHYQGHANAYVLSSEHWVKDQVNNRRDIPLLVNTGKPWVFFGMGCHIADWAQNPVLNRTMPRERSLTEKMLLRTDAGASAGYASSGYEYISNNRVFGERMFRLWTRRPPVVPAHGGSERSRWVLGELMWAAEAEHLAASFGSTIDREMVAQYVLLGDPLMTLDAGPPRVTAVLEGSPDQEIAGTFDLVATDPGNRRTLRVAARDEAGIDRLRVVDSDGVDLTDQVVVMADSLPPGQADHQEVHYRLEVPVRPYPHSIDVEVWDTGAPLPADRHWTLTLAVGQEVAFTAGGQPVDPATFAFTPGEPVDFRAVVSGAAWLHAGTTWALTSPDLELTNIVLPSLKDNTAELSFTATAPEGEGERSVVLTIDGHATTWVLQAGEQAPPAVTISRVYSFPNPMAGQTRFLFETGAAGGQGVIRVFAVSGRTVARIPFSFGGGGAGVVEWNGRDGEGDELANGTYLYRVELDAPGGRITSPVQRLVVMR